MTLTLNFREPIKIRDGFVFAGVDGDKDIVEVAKAKISDDKKCVTFECHYLDFVAGIYWFYSDRVGPCLSSDVLNERTPFIVVSTK